MISAARATGRPLGILYSVGNFTRETKVCRAGSDTSKILRPWPLPSASALSFARDGVLWWQTVEYLPHADGPEILESDRVPAAVGTTGAKDL